MSVGGRILAVGARGEFSEVAVVVTLPVMMVSLIIGSRCRGLTGYPHLIVEDLGLASLGLGDKSLIQNVQDILANLLQLFLDLLTVFTHGAKVLLVTFRLLLLLDGGDDAPGGTAGADHVLVGNREKVAFIDSELATDLKLCQSWLNSKGFGSPVGHGDMMVSCHTLATSYLTISMELQQIIWLRLTFM